jgi:rubrerythrin
MVSLNKEVEVDVETQKAIDKLQGLKSFWCYASEEVQYAVEIKAHSEEEAWEMVGSGAVTVTTDDIVDGNHFEWLEITENN